jgi:membrane-associated protein
MPAALTPQGSDMDLNQLLDLFLHLDVYLNDLAAACGPWLYGLLFLVIFCETGLVVTPILPGDSLLFAVGALAATNGSPLNIVLLIVLLAIAGILGDAVNYAIGWYVGPKVFSREKSRLLNKNHLFRAQRFYEKYGGKTIILARFMPIIRTFAPFVAGIGKMKYRRFAIFNVAGGLLWVATFLLGGFYFGNVEQVKDNFTLVILAICIISIMPAVLEVILSRRRKEPPTNDERVTLAKEVA